MGLIAKVSMTEEDARRIYLDLNGEIDFILNQLMKRRRWLTSPSIEHWSNLKSQGLNELIPHRLRDRIESFYRNKNEYNTRWKNYTEALDSILKNFRHPSLSIKSLEVNYLKLIFEDNLPIIDLSKNRLRLTETRLKKLKKLIKDNKDIQKYKVKLRTIFNQGKSIKRDIIKQYKIDSLAVIMEKRKLTIASLILTSVLVLATIGMAGFTMIAVKNQIQLYQPSVEAQVTTDDYPWGEFTKEKPFLYAINENQLKSEVLKIPIYYKIYNKGLVPALLYNIGTFKECDFSDRYVVKILPNRSHVIAVGESYEFKTEEVINTEEIIDKLPYDICYVIAGSGFNLIKKIRIVK